MMVGCVAVQARASRRGGRQRGEVTLIGLLLAVSIATAALNVMFNVQRRQMERADAEAAGVLVAQTADALRRLLTMAPSNAAVVPPGTQNGVAWLRPPACGGRAQNPALGFVPCSFGDNFWAPNFQTTITNVGGRWEARLTFRVPDAFDRDRIGTVADYIAEKANTHLTATPLNAPAPGVVTPGFVTVMTNVPANANNLAARPAIMNNPASADFGRVVVVVSNDPSTDTFLRTDGTNRMEANLNLNNNDLINGRDLQAQRATLQDRLTSNRVILRPGLAGAIMGAGCTTSGEVATDPQGLLLACQSGRWFPAGTQVVRNTNDVCTRPGSYGELAADGTGMICQNGRWIPLQARMGSIVPMASFVASNGTTIPKPNCALVGAAPRIYVVPKSWFPNTVSASSNNGPPPTLSVTSDMTPWHFYAIDSGNNWTIRVDSSGNRGGVALVITACSFV